MLTHLNHLIPIIRKFHQTGPSKPTKTTTPPPGPWKLPIIGNLHQLAMNGGQSRPHRRLAELAKQYGPDVMHLQLGELPHVIVSTPEAAKQVMKTHDLTFASRPPLLAAYIVFGGGYNDIACAPYGEHWRQLRKISTLELLSAKRVQSFRGIREEEVSNLVTNLRGLSPAAANRLGSQRGGEIASLPNDNAVVDLGKALNKLSGSITSRAIFGQSRGVNEVLLIVDDFTDASGGFRISDLYPSLTFLPALTGFEAELKKIHQRAHSVLSAIIDERRSRRNPSRSCGEDEGEEDNLIDVLLNLQENPSQMGFTLNMEVIEAVTLELMIAGIDTSSKVMEWTMSELMRHPRALQRAQKEVRQVFHESGNVDEAGLHQLKYLDCVIKEGLRLHPPAPLLLPREKNNGEEVELCGYRIEEKTKVLVNAWAINRHSRYWSEAEKFRPERFVDCSTSYKGNDFHFIPFGAGRRICPGYDYGLNIVKLTLANLLFHFRWRLPGNMKPEGLDMTECFGAVVRRKNPLLVIPVPHP